MSSLSCRALRELAAPSSSRRIIASSSWLPRASSSALSSSHSPAGRRYASSNPKEREVPVQWPSKRKEAKATFNLKEAPLSDITKDKAARKNKADAEARVDYNQGIAVPLLQDHDPDAANYRRLAANDAAGYQKPPTRAKMLVREFIHDSLYNPHYGYFSKNVDIFTPEDAEGYKFKSISDQAMFQELMGERYETEYATPQDGLGRQVWHTPTELFKPYYARALTSAIVSQYKRNHFPHQDLLIYEVGAGNGSFMFDAMRFIRDEYPEIFARTKYRIVEISSALSHIQRKRAHDAGFTNVEVINQDFFKWKGGTTDPCFVVALEVFDNLSHDLVRYDMKTLEPKQAVVSINKEGDFSLEYETVTDPLLRRALEYRRLLPLAPNTQPPLSKAMLSSPALRNLYVNLPFAPNLSPPEFVPTKAVSFLERLRDQLPAHRLLMADFSELPEAVEGRNGPVVQTRYRNQMVPCSTFLVKQGYFDIFFPTDFELLRDVYGLIMNSPARRVTPPGAKGSSGEAEAATVDEQAAAAAAASSSSSAASDPNPTPSTSIKGARAQKALDDDFFSPSGVRGFRRRHVGVYTQAEFIVKYGGEAMVGPTRMKDGLSPMLTMYDNAKIMF